MPEQAGPDQIVLPEPRDGRKLLVKAMRRLHELIQMMLAAPRHRDEIAGAMQRDPSTVTRDIGVLRGMGIDIQGTRRQPCTTVPNTLPLFLAPGEVRALQHAWEIALQVELPEEAALRALLERVPDPIQRLARARDARMAFPSSPADYLVYGETIDAIRRCIGTGRQMELVYQVFNKPRPWEFLLDAAELHWMEGALILFAYCPNARGDTPLAQTRELRIDRILKLVCTDRACILPCPPKFEFRYRLGAALVGRFHPPPRPPAARRIPRGPARRGPRAGSPARPALPAGLRATGRGDHTGRFSGRGGRTKARKKHTIDCPIDHFSADEVFEAAKAYNSQQTLQDDLLRMDRGKGGNDSDGQHHRNPE